VEDAATAAQRESEELSSPSASSSPASPSDASSSSARASSFHPSRIPAQLEEQLDRELNAILLDKDLYDDQRFKHVALTTTVKGLRDLRSTFKSFQTDAAAPKRQSSQTSATASPPSAEIDEDLAHFNRLLLENAYPEVFEHISDIRLAAIYKRLHQQKQTALSLSGGGIRSGTFALGLLQGFARHRLLEKFDYLSTVSGGGYIGSWLTAWIHRHPEGLEGVTRDLANRDPETKVDPDPPPLRYLRQYSSFLTPKVGLLSADTWSFAGIYVRNLLLNWAVIIPLFVAVLLIPRLAVAAILGQSENPIRRHFQLSDWSFGFHYYPRYTLLLLGTFFVVMAIAYIGFNRPSASEQLKARSPFWAKHTDQRGFLVFCLLPLVASAILLTTYAAWSRNVRDAQTATHFTLLGELRLHRVVLFLLFGVLTTLLGWFWYTFLVLRRGKRGRRDEIKLLEFGALLVAGLFGGFLFWVASVSEFGNPVVALVDASPPTWSTEIYACLAVPLFLLLFMLATFFYVGVSSYSRGVRDEEREWLSRLGAWLIIVAIVWSVFSALVIFGPLALLDSPKILASLGGVSGLTALLLGRSSATPANQKEAAKASPATLIMSNILPLLTLVFLVIFVAALSLLTSLLIKSLFLWPRFQSANWIVSIDPYAKYQYFEGMTSRVLAAVHMRAVHYPSFWFFFILAVGLALFGLLMARVINLNLFSLHGGYRNRLIRGFLGASRNEGERKPNPFTGFDPTDNVKMHELRPALLNESDFQTRWGTTDQNLKALTLRLKAMRDPQPADKQQPDYAMSKFLYEHLHESRDKIDDFSGDAPLSQALQRMLLEDLNRILENEEIRFYREPSLRHYIKTARARRVERLVSSYEESNQPTRGEYQVLLNRLMMEQAYERLIKTSPYPPPPYKLFHVVNTALNLVGGDNLAWQQRRAEPFSVSPLHSGCFRLGYRKSRDYGGEDGISIGTAAAISGAAASSNMGYYTTSPVMSLLMTVFNVRLGWWLGNPGLAGNKSYWTPDPANRGKNQVYRREAPTLSLLPVLHEALGMTDDRNSYVYLTDGGHFENLALYEMVLRRCHIIVCSDGAQDENYQFGDLGNAVRKIRIDFGIPIEFSKMLIYKQLPEDGGGFYWSVAKIRYSCIDPGAEDGVLVYIKPAVYQTNEPRDVLEYKESHPAFPHESTGDQFFDEPQFESYRALGSHIIDQICGEGWEELDPTDFALRAYAKSKPLDDKLEALLPDWLIRKSNQA
jgi:hypothetical protein